MIEHLSKSSVTKYMMCAKSWEFRYVKGLGGPTTVNMPFGSAFHETVERAIMGEGTMAELWPIMWRNEVEKRDKITWDGQTYESCETRGQRMVDSKSIRDTVGAIVPMKTDKGRYMIEYRVKFWVDGIDVPIYGIVDLVENDGVPGDFKTVKSKWTDEKAATELEPLIYLKALKSMGYECPHNFFRYYLFCKQTSKAYRMQLAYSDDRIEWGMDQLRAVYKGIMAGAFPACTPMAWWCSPTRCEYWEHCQT